MPEDPFERWRQVVSQWSGGGPPDPTALGPTGWPMLPFPGVGMAGGEDPLSPAAGTKTAVRQLYRTLEELEAQGAAADTLFGGAGLPGDGDGTDMWAAYRQALGLDPEAEDAGAAGMGSMLVGTYLVWLYSLGALLLESYAMRLVHDEVVVEDHRNTADTLEWLVGQSQADREELLRRSTDIDDDLVDEMAAVRRGRNDLVYNLGRWDAVDLDDPVGDARAYLAVLRALDERVSDGDPFAYLPGQDQRAAESGDAGSGAAATSGDDNARNDDGGEDGTADERTGDEGKTDERTDEEGTAAGDAADGA